MTTIAEAREQLSAGRYTLAKEIAQSLVAANPSDAAAITVLGAVAGDSGDIAGAIAQFRRAAELAPNDPNIAIQLGLALMAAGLKSDAVLAFRRCLGLGFYHPSVHDRIAVLCAEQKDYASAIAALTDSLARWPGRAETLSLAASIYREVGDWGQVLEFATRAISAGSADFRAHGLVGDAYATRGELSNAVGYYRKALSLGGGTAVDHDYFTNRIADDELVLALAGSLRTADQRKVAADVNPKSRGPAGNSAPPTFVYFHADLGGEHPFAKLKIGEHAEKIEYRNVLTQSMQSVRAAAPGCRIVLLTNRADEAFEHLDLVFQVPVDTNRLMYSRMKAYREVAAQGAILGPAYFLDTDIYHARNMASAFDGSFEIGLTYRTQPAFTHMPINEGVILAAVGSAPATLRFFDACLAYYDEFAQHPSVLKRYNFDVRHWRGGQLALAAFVGWTVPPRAPENVNLHGVRVRFFPCDQYNAPVDEESNLLDYRDRVFLHFKGKNVKNRMAEFARLGSTS